MIARDRPTITTVADAAGLLPCGCRLSYAAGDADTPVRDCITWCRTHELAGSAFDVLTGLSQSHTLWTGPGAELGAGFAARTPKFLQRVSSLTGLADYLLEYAGIAVPR